MELNNISVDLLPSNFKYHDFNIQICEINLSCHIIIMHDSLFIWIGDCNDGKLNDLSFGFISNYDNTPLATKLMGAMEDTVSSNIAKKLAKKLGKPIYISFNSVVNQLLLPRIEKSIHEELQKQSDILTL